MNPVIIETPVDRPAPRPGPNSPQGMARRVVLRMYPLQTIYVARCGDRIKIGISIHAVERVRELAKVAGPMEMLVEFPGIREDEQRLLGRFARLRVFGEWFSAVPELLEWADEKRIRHRRR